MTIELVEHPATVPGAPGPFLLLHGGGGPRTMAGLADLLADHTGAHVLLPTHPGFAGTPRPESLDSARRLAAAYVDLLDHRELTDVTVIGNSFGGWLAAEIALTRSPRINAAVIVDGVGIEVPGHPVADVRGLTPTELAQLSWHDPSKAPVPPSQGGTGPSPDVQALLAYCGPDMVDPTLLGRLAAVTCPVHVIWGESDRIVDAAYGRAYADAIPRSRLTLIPRSGHLPQLETPATVLRAITESPD